MMAGPSNTDNPDRGGKNMPLVSVAIISFNQKQFLRECVDSVLAQDYENIESVVADDGSTDGSQEMLRDYQNRHPDMLVLRLASENRGITANSNAAHFACSGDYIAWMGGDDLMLPGKIRSQVDIMEADSSVSICYHDLDVFESASNETLYLFSEKCAPRTGSFGDVIAYGTFNGACSNMVRRSTTPDHGFDDRLPVASDWKYWMDTLANGGRIHYIDRVLGRYRRHESNVTRGKGVVSLAVMQDHLMSVSLLLSEYPRYARQLLRRQADVLRGLRNVDDGERYMAYLLASLRTRMTAKTAAGILANFIGRRF